MRRPAFAAAALLACGLAPAAVARQAGPAPELTRAQAREIALRSHPKITVAQLRALAVRQTVTEARAAYLPNLAANAAGVVAAEDDTRIASGALPVSSVFNRVSAGVSLSQLITDFGRTSGLTETSRLRADAEDKEVQATRAQIVLQVDTAYLAALQAQAVLQVAQETVATRQVLRDRIAAFAANQLKSDLDVSFAEVSLQEGKLLVFRAENDVEAAFARLAALLGSRKAETYKLVDEPLPAAGATTVDDLVTRALAARPELGRLRLERDAARAFARAERSLHYPTLSLLGSAGVVPFRDAPLNETYAAAGLVLSVPLYTGQLYAARSDEAAHRAEAAEASLQDEENRIARDVRVAGLNAENAAQRLTVTAKLLEHARRSFDLADARYKAGTSSIVELSQAQLARTSAEITHTGAKYEYLLRRAIVAFELGQNL